MASLPLKSRPPPKGSLSQLRTPLCCVRDSFSKLSCIASPVRHVAVSCARRLLSRGGALRWPVLDLVLQISQKLRMPVLSRRAPRRRVWHAWTVSAGILLPRSDNQDRATVDSFLAAVPRSAPLTFSAFPS